MNTQAAARRRGDTSQHHLGAAAPSSCSADLPENHQKPTTPSQMEKPSKEEKLCWTLDLDLVRDSKSRHRNFSLLVLLLLLLLNHGPTQMVSITLTRHRNPESDLNRG